jgi:hypothetical protein
MKHDLDVNNRAWTRTLGELTLIGTWLRVDGGQWRPCMVIIRASDEGSDRTTPCIVTADNAWIWSEAVGDPKQAARAAFNFARALRLDEHDPRVMVRLAMLIEDHLDDLLHIPPRPAELKEVVAEAKLTDNRSGQVTQTELQE